MSEAMRVLIIEDSADDAELMALELRRSGLELTWERVEDIQALERRLIEERWDVVLTDHALPQLRSTDVIRLVHAIDPNTPCILVSGKIGEEAAAAAIRQGASGFVSKPHLGRLGPVVERELRDAAGRRAHRRAIEALRESEERYRQLAEAMPDPVAVHQHGRLVYVNRAAARFLGAEESRELVGRPVVDFIHPEERQAARLERHELLKGRRPMAVERRFVRPDGSTVYGEAVAVPILYHGEPAVLVAVRDVTARKELEEELREAHAELQRHAHELEDRVEERTRELREAQQQLLEAERQAVLGRVAGALAHEMRHPLGVLTNLAFLMQLQSGEAQVERRTQAMEREIRRLNAHLIALLDFTHPVMLNLTEVDLAALLQIVLEASPPPEPIRVRRRLRAAGGLRADPAALGKAISCLVRNAYQAMSNGGQLLIETRRRGAWIELRIGDSGPGISAEELKKVFQPLYTTRAFGLGLGLPTAKLLIEAHGGQLELESRTGRGTTAVIRLPTTVENQGAR